MTFEDWFNREESRYMGDAWDVAQEAWSYQQYRIDELEQKLALRDASLRGLSLKKLEKALESKR